MYGMNGWNKEISGGDLISRAAAIDAIDEIESEIAEGCGFDYEKWRKHFCNLPPAQPEKRTEERTEKHACDCISRQAAIDAIGEKADEIYKTKQKGATYPHNDFFQGMAYAEAVVKQLPSAQPETAKRIVGKSKDGMTLWYQCDMCNEPVDAQDNFCRECGRRLTDG